MRTLRLIVLAIVAIVMSVNFTACSDDDDDFNISDLEGLWEGVTSEFEEKENGQVVDKDTESLETKASDLSQMELSLLIISLEVIG